jgi:hypothetical protein
MIMRSRHGVAFGSSSLARSLNQKLTHVRTCVFVLTQLASKIFWASLAQQKAPPKGSALIFDP